MTTTSPVSSRIAGRPAMTHQATPWVITWYDMICWAPGRIAGASVLPEGASATQGVEASTRKNSDPVRRTARKTSDSASTPLGSLASWPEASAPAGDADGRSSLARTSASYISDPVRACTRRTGQQAIRTHGHGPEAGWRPTLPSEGPMRTSKRTVLGLSAWLLVLSPTAPARGADGEDAALGRVSPAWRDGAVVAAWSRRAYEIAFAEDQFLT